MPTLTVAEPLLGPLNHVLVQSDWALARLQPFVGQVAAFHLSGLTFRLAVEPNGGLRFASTDEPTAVDIEVPAEALRRIAQGKEAVLAAARLRGKADFAEAIGFVIRHVRWDLEDDLSRLVGDVAAHRVAGAAARFEQAARDSFGRLVDSGSEYLRHEIAALADASAVGDFGHDVDELRDGVERLDARLRALEARVGLAPRGE